MIWGCNDLHECRQWSKRSVAASVLPGTRRIDLGMVMLSKGVILGQLSLWTKEWPRERRDDASGRCSAGTSCRLSSGVSDETGHVSWSWCRSKFNHYRCPLRFLFLRVLGRRNGAEWFIFWLGESRRSLHSEGKRSGCFSHPKLFLEIRAGTTGELMSRILTSWQMRSCDEVDLEDSTYRKIHDRNPLFGGG